VTKTAQEVIDQLLERRPMLEAEFVAASADVHAAVAEARLVARILYTLGARTEARQVLKGTVRSYREWQTFKKQAARRK
jgi:hypothetical protein